MANKGPWNDKEVMCPPLTEMSDAMKKMVVANIKAQLAFEQKENKVCDCECHLPGVYVMHVQACC